MDIVRTLQGDTVDMVARRHFGDESGFVELILSANPGLAERGLILPLGTEISLPEVAAAAEVVPVITLWD